MGAPTSSSNPSAEPGAPSEPVPERDAAAHATRAETFLARLVWAPIASGCIAVVTIAAWLRADARGFGTHEQLGIPPCMFSAATHVPCPGCGLTTSFTHMAHLHFYEAFRAHLMGPLLFLVTLFVALYGPYAMVRGRSPGVLLDSRAALPVLGVTALAGLLTFALRLAHVLPAH